LSQLASKRDDDINISSAVLPNGRRIKLLKTLLTSACERNCYYCPFRAGRDFRRATFKPDEMAQTSCSCTGLVLLRVYSKFRYHPGRLTTQDKLIATAEILRQKYQYRDYLHLKLMPGVEKPKSSEPCSFRPCLNKSRSTQYPKVSPACTAKDFMDELLNPCVGYRKFGILRAPSRLNGRWPSSVTQFVVGAVGEKDLELLSTTEQLYRNLRLRRTYFSAFHPVSDTPLENNPATPAIREARLYEASFLLRDYGFGLEELPFDAEGNLPLPIDPKTAWAQINLKEMPVELNKATRQELLRIPGIGLHNADLILRAPSE
jgi:predicted DNA-binding helix-hairpin-helix protein